MQKSLETDRLILRPLKLSDYAFVRTLHTDPKVMRYIASGPARSEAQTRESIQKSLAMKEANPCLGTWIAELRETQVTMGTLILRTPATAEKTEGIEIGFIFAAEHWGKGYATEASRRLIQYVHDALGDVRIVALINAANQASRNTLQKLGFKTVGTTEYVNPVGGEVLPSEILEYQTLDPTP